MIIPQRKPVFRVTATILSVSLLAMGCSGVGGAGGGSTVSAEDTATDPDTCTYPEELDVGDPDDDTCDDSSDTSTGAVMFSAKVHTPMPLDDNCNQMLFDCLKGCNDRLGTGLNSCAANTWGAATQATTVIAGLTLITRVALSKTCTLARFKSVLTGAGIALAIVDALFVLTDVLGYYDCCRPFRTAYATCRQDCFRAAGK